MGATFKTLLVAPDIDIPEQTEQVQDVINSLGPKTLLGRVTRFDLVRELNGDKFDVIWITCHASMDGIMLSDGAVDGDTFASLLRAHSPRLVYLNTCENSQVALDLHDAVRCPLICTIKPLDVMRAYYTGATLARYLAQGMSVRAAFETSRPGHDETYRLIGASDMTDQHDRIDIILEKIADIHRLASRNSDRLDNIEAQLLPSRSRALAWTVGYWVFVSIFPVTFVEFRRSLDLNFSSGLILIVMLAALAYVPLSQALQMRVWRID